MRQSICWWCFRGRGIGDAALLDAARDIGFDAIDLLPADLWPAAKERGLGVSLHGGHASLTEGLNDPTQHDRIAGEIARNLELAAEHAIPNLVVFAGNRRPGVSDEDAVRITADGLRRVAPLAERAGVTLVLELLNSKVDHRGYQADRTAWGAAVCAAVGSPRVKLLYDIYHMQVMEGDLIRTIRAHHPVIGHYHTAGCPGRGDIGDAQEIHYPAVFAAIRAAGYDGYVGHEYVPKGDLMEGLRQAYKLARG